MLESQKKLYEQKADIIPNWRKINKNDLVNLYIQYENEPQLADGYMSAIICRYWGAISKYYTTSRNSVTVEECYDWLIRSILYAIQRRDWLDPNNKLYTDPNAPDKVINRVIISTRLGFFQGSNTHKRKSNYGTKSFEGMLEDNPESENEVMTSEDLPGEEGWWDIKNIVQNAFKKKDYVKALMVDTIAYYDVFDRERGEDGYWYSQFNPKKLSRHLRNAGEKYCQTFAETYGVQEGEVQQAVQECKDLSRTRLYTAIRRNLKVLAKSKELLLEE